MSLNIWATYVGKFVSKNFQKSPNLVSLRLAMYFILLGALYNKGNTCLLGKRL